jgi:hypothetical protein
MHHAKALDLLVDNARNWMPDLGIGIRPDGEPPRMLNASDLSKLKWNEMPKIKHETIFRLASDLAPASALPKFCGSGALLYCLLESPVENYLSEQRELWLPAIHDPAFRAHSFYLPLFERQSLEEREPSILLKWMGSAAVYLRENIEENGVLILSSRKDALDRLCHDLHSL